MTDGKRKLRVFDGTSNSPLAIEVCRHLGVEKGDIVVSNFLDGETNVKIGESVRGAHVFIIQPTAPPVNESLMKLLIIIDALKRASAAKVTAVVPYYGYSRQEKKTSGREPITAKLVANLLTEAGADRIMTFDLHAWAIQGFFDIPVDHLTSLPIICDYLKAKADPSEFVVVSPDAGGVGRARAYGKRLDTTIAIIDKRRPKPNVAESMNLIGDVKNKRAILVDDIIDTAGTIAASASMLAEHGAKEIYVAATHPIFSGPAYERLRKAPVKEIIVTDSIIIPEEKRFSNLTVLSVAPLISEVIYRIHNEVPVSSLFE
ncbi:MAG TPA: ribose-phosphate pyrophosphokinase [Candidatus Wallbacteria bacterium]|nr:ribose-phosphate pyrophosphokinase [Candidatus Wallbacteria bacterium]